MTRINLIDPGCLLDQHLLAEYRELPRVFTLARPDRKLPETYRMGKGHVLFFYDKLRFLSNRHVDIVQECIRRGFDVQNTRRLRVPGYGEDNWCPSEDEWWVSLRRLDERLQEKPNFYRYYGAPVEPDHYDRAGRGDVL